MNTFSSVNSALYEYPLTEKIRLLLKLEYLFDQLHSFLETDNPWASKQCLQLLLDLLTLTQRHELKSDLLQEFDKLITQPDVFARRGISMDQYLAYRENLHGFESNQIESLRRNDFLSALKQRIGMVGGSCSFDLPVLAHWLRLPYATRRTAILEWLSVFQVFLESIQLILGLLRNHQTSQQTIETTNGFFSQNVPNKTLLIQLDLSSYPKIYPEISGNYHKITIHFLEQATGNSRGRTIAQDISVPLLLGGY